MLAIMRRAAGLCLLLVMSACGEEPSAHGADGANCPKPPRRSYVHALRRDHRALLGPPGSGRDSLGVAVHVRAGTRLASCRAAGDAVRRRRTVHHLRAPVSRARLGKHGANLGGRLQGPVHAPVRDDGDGRGRRNVGRDHLFYGGSCRAQRVHGSNATKFANSVWHGVRNHLKRPAAGQKRLGRVGSVCNGRPRGRDENRRHGTLSPLRSVARANHPVGGTGIRQCLLRLGRSWFGCDRGYRDSAEVKFTRCACGLARITKARRACHRGSPGTARAGCGLRPLVATAADNVGCEPPQPTFQVPGDKTGTIGRRNQVDQLLGRCSPQELMPRPVPGGNRGAGH